jgi:hypothetical protein
LVVGKLVALGPGTWWSNALLRDAGLGVDAGLLEEFT